MAANPEDDATEDQIARLRHRVQDAVWGSKAPSPVPRTEIHGDNNVMGDHNTVNHYHEAPVIRPKIVVQPGADCITAEQQFTLQELVREIVAIEARLKRKPRGYEGVWGGLKRKMKVPSYHLIPLERFEEARQYLVQQKARLNAMALAPAKNPDWRNARIRAIKARSKEFPDGDGRVKAYLERRFSVASLRDVDDEQLEACYRHVMGWKR